MTKTQLSTIVPPETRQAYDRLMESTGVSLTDILTAAVPLLEQHYRQAELVAGYIQLDRWGDLDASALCPECGQSFGPPPFDPPGPHDDSLNLWRQPLGGLPWIAVLANGATCPPICSRCATSE